MSDRLDWVRADQLDRTQLILQNDELRSMLKDMHAECDEHEDNDAKIIGELRVEVERLKQIDAARFELFKARNEEVERLRAALRQILEDPDAHILDSHRDDGWEALVKPKE